MDARELRNVLGSFVTGVTVVTTVDGEGADQGVTANSFSSVSLDPPLVLWSQAKSARSFPAFRDSDRFIVNILSEHQRSISQRFATPGQDKFAGFSTLRLNGLPAVPECCAYLQCRKVAMYPGGDHIVYLGEVVEVERNDRRPLAFARGKYMVAFEHDMNFELREDGAHLAHNDAVRLGCAALAELANRTGTAVGLAVWGNRGATIIRWELAPRVGAPELRTGVVMSPFNSATGLLFGAFLPEQMTAPVLGDALARTGLAKDDLDRMRTELGQCLAGVRTAGIVSSPEVTSAGLYGISAPVFDAAGHMILALCAVVAQADDPGRIRSIENECRQCARTLSKRLGYAEPQPEAA